jgi:hypothetical protein
MPTLSLVPQVVALRMYAGDGATLRVAVRDVLGAPVDLTGAVTAQIRALRTDAAATVSFTVDLSGHANGVATLSLTGVQTQALIVAGAPFKGSWDVSWTPAGGQPMTLVQGEVSCDLDVTR